MSTITYREPDFTLEGTRSSLNGEAIFDATIEYECSADVGGIDGWLCERAELLRIEMDGASLSRDWVETYLGTAALKRIEEATAEQISNNISEVMEAA